MLSRWLSGWRRMREARTLARRPIPEPLWQLTLARYPFLQRRNAADRQTLREMATLFLAQKEFTGAHGFPVTDEIAVAVAAQACLPILRLGLHCYDGFVGIVMHDDEVVARREVVDEDGIVHHYDETLTGEAMENGPVMLSWRDVEAAGDWADQGYNVVIHEFAHVLDMRDGAADGVPLLANHAARQAWLDVLGAEYERLCERIDRGEHTRIDPYAAESMEEFFAVASEVFFVAPSHLMEEHPRLYHLLRGYYRPKRSEPAKA